MTSDMPNLEKYTNILYIVVPCCPVLPSHEHTIIADLSLVHNKWSEDIMNSVRVKVQQHGETARKTSWSIFDPFNGHGCHLASILFNFAQAKVRRFYS